MPSPNEGSDFYREYDLADARRHGVAKSPFPHQEEALKKLDKWYKSAPTEPRGGILVRNGSSVFLGAADRGVIS